MTEARDRFERFFKQLYGRSPAGEEGAAALPTTIAETVRALDPRAFGTIAHSTLATAPFLLALEESQIPGTSLRYVLVHDEIGPAGFLLLTTVQLDGSGAGPLPTRRREDQDQLARVVIGGHPLIHGSHFFDFRDPEPTPSLLATIVRAAYHVRKQEGIAVSLLKDFPDAGVRRLAPLEGYGYVRFETRPTMFLAIDHRWKTFGGYLASLPARSRKLVRERQRAFEAQGLVLERARPTPIAAELAELYAHFRHRMQPGLALLTPYFFRAIEDHLRDAFRLWVVRRDGRIIAFACAVHDRLPAKGRNRLLGLFLGFNVRLDDELHLHPNLQYKLVEEAIAEGFDVLDLGRGSRQIALELGAQPERLHCFVRHRNPEKNALTRALFENIIQPPWPSERHARR